MNAKLQRSRTDKRLAGVCGGLARYLNMDSTLVRVIFVLLFFFTGFGLLAYLLLWVLLPQEEAGKEAFTAETIQSGAEEIAEKARDMAKDVQQGDAARMIGLVLIILGAFLLLQTLSFPWLRWISFRYLWPLLLVAAGLVLIFRQGRRG